MNIEDGIYNINKMRYLENEGDYIEIIENILSEIAQNADNNAIIALCTIFDDDIDEPAIIGGVIETIFYIAERNGLEEGLYKLTEGITDMQSNARKCVRRLCKSLLNSEDLIEPFINVLRKLAPSQKDEIINILKELSDKQPLQYRQKMNFMLKQINY